MGAIGAIAEPLVVITLLFGGTWVNRDKDPGGRNSRRRAPFSPRRISDDIEADGSLPNSYDGLLEKRGLSPSSWSDREPKYRKRTVGLFGMKKEVVTPNTRQFRDRRLSQLLERFPFLVECWYWALIYWVYQLGRAFTATLITTDVVDSARHHALTVIAWEQALHIFWELPIQHFFLSHPHLMTWINRTYSFIHIPGSIAFLVWLFYYTTARNRSLPSSPRSPTHPPAGSPAGPALYQSRRRTMALCNLLAFAVFTLWPCMPPRLLSDPTVTGETGHAARAFGFLDTVHGEGGEGSVWTQNRFCNQYAAMPSLHFGYSLLIGLTVMTVPLAPAGRRRRVLGFRVPGWGARRAACVGVGVAYPAVILVAIVATANHFILDAVAGGLVCAVAWWGNDVLLNLLAVEDWFLWGVRIHKPELETVEWGDD